MYKQIFSTPVPYRSADDPSLGSGTLIPLYTAYPDLDLVAGEVIHSVNAFFVNAENTASSPFTILLAVNVRTIYHAFIQTLLKFDGTTGAFLGYEDPFYAPPGYLYSEVVQSIDGSLWASTNGNLVPLDPATRAAADTSAWIPATFFEVPSDQSFHDVHHPMVDKSRDLIVMSASPNSVDGRYILVNRFSTGELLRRIWVSGPISQIIQEDERRCFVVCTNGILNVVDFTTGSVLSTTSSPAVHTVDGQAFYAWAPSLRRLLAFNFVDANRAFLGGPPVNSDGSSPDTITGYYPVPIATNITRPIPLKPPRKGRTVPMLVRAVGDAGEAIPSLPISVTATAPGAIGPGTQITDSYGYATINLVGTDAGSRDVTATANVD
ncbi:MAG: Ig-like domain-containing protein [Burkholderiales bacterium]